MNEQEIIEYLKKNKEDCVIFMKMPKPVQKYVEKNINENILLRMWYDGKFFKYPEDKSIDMHNIFALPDDYEAPKVEPEVLEFDVDINEEGLSFFGIYKGKLERPFKIPTHPLYLDNYMFIGYKFEGYNDLYNFYFGYHRKDADDRESRMVIQRKPIDNDFLVPVYANKVVYQKAEG